MCTDPNRLRLEMVDDMINATSKTFLGLSISCARCHDHKFDPIPTADYYALAGIFRSTKIVGDFSEYWRDGRVRLLRPLAMPDEVAANEAIAAQVDAKKALRWKYLADHREALLARWQADAPRYLAAAAQIRHPYTRNFEAEDFDGVYNLRIAELSFDGKVVQVIETLNPTLQWVRYKFEVPADGNYGSRLLYSSNDKSPITLQVNGTNITEEGLKPAARAGGGWDLKFLGEVLGSRSQPFEPEFGAELPVRIDAQRRQLSANRQVPALQDRRWLRCEISGRASRKRQKLHPAGTGEFRQARCQSIPGPAWRGSFPYLDEAEQKPSGGNGSRNRRAGKHDPAARMLVVAVSDQARPLDMPIHIRGGVDSVSPSAVPRNVPRLFDDLVPRPAVPGAASGRMELARWITDPRNPLTARVMANRVWQWHFGRGLVQTPSDFGSRGTPPTHPELLDWLASTLVDERWSLKKLHRLILLSSTYRMSGNADPPVMAADPDNRDLSRFSPRRLDAEELFDAMFSSTNVLVHQESGKPLDLQKSLGRGMYVLTTNRAPPGLGPDVRKMLMLFDLDFMRRDRSTAARTIEHAWRRRCSG